MAGPVIVEGRWAVEALLESSRFTARRVFLQSGRHEDVKAKAETAGLPVTELSREELSERAGFDFHRGVYAEAYRPEPREPTAEFVGSATRLVIPVGLADPGNLGTIVRSAAAFGADGILVERGKGADIYGRKAIRASARAIFFLPVFECEDLAARLTQLKISGFSLFATDLDQSAKPISEARRPEKSAILFGTESDGLPSEILDQCDERLRIPMANEMDSLNVAASAAVVMWEMFGRE